jgi:hypothetical protein
MISGTILVLETLLRLSLWAGVCQFIGTVLIVWSLKVTTQAGGTVYLYGKDGPPAHQHAAIVREHPWAVKWGVWVLLLGLALQVVAAIL